MKNLLILGLLITSTNVFASKFQDIKGLSNKKLEAARAQIVKLDLITHENTKKVTELKGKGQTPQQVRERTVAQAMHTLCPFFDDGVSIGLNTKDDAGAIAAAKELAEYWQVDVEDQAYQDLLSAAKAMNAEAGVELYSGSASGNNTGGTVLGLYDTKNNELAVFANTNCGSDD